MVEKQQWGVQEAAESWRQGEAQLSGWCATTEGQNCRVVVSMALDMGSLGWHRGTQGESLGCYKGMGSTRAHERIQP